MSGISLTTDQVAMLFGATSGNVGSSMLNTLYGIATPSGGVAPQQAIAALQTAETNQTKDIAQTAQQPQVQRDVAAFTAAVQGATSVAQLLSNPLVLKVLLTAGGLSDQIAYPALAQKALMSDPTDSNSLVNQLTDTSWKTLAQTYSFAAKGLSVIQSSATIATVANAYAEVTWRQSLDATTPGLSNALTFRAQASSVTTVDQILADPTLRTVVTTALGVPEQIAFQELGAQENAITSRLDITQFKDPAFVERFTQRYLMAAQQSASDAAAAAAAANGTTAAGSSIYSLAFAAQGLIV